MPVLRNVGRQLEVGDVVNRLGHTLSGVAVGVWSLPVARHRRSRRQPRVRGRPVPDPARLDRPQLRVGEGMTMTVTASYSEPRETMRTMSGDVTTITGVDVTVEYEYGATTAALAALDRAAEHVRAQILATTTPVIAARPDYKEGWKP